MAIITIPTSRVALGFHLCGQGAVLSGSIPPSPYAFFSDVIWPGVAEVQYNPDPSFLASNDQTIDVSGFGNSLFFNFPTGSNLGGGIQAFMANLESYNYGEIKISNARRTAHTNYTSPYVSNCGTFNPRNLNGVVSFGDGGVGRFEIYWDYETYYPGGFELTINSKVFGGKIGFYRGVSEVCGLTGTDLNLDQNFKINGNGPDGTPVGAFNTYRNDGAAQTDLVITIPWKDILAVEAIFVYFIEGDPI
jgi:hypothetical protein